MFDIEGDGAVKAILSPVSPDQTVKRRKISSDYSISAGRDNPLGRVGSDGRFVAVWERNPAAGADIHILSLDGDRALEPFLTTSASERDPSFSPNGRYLAYSSNVSGRYEVYVREVSGSGGQATISNNGGRWPRWSPTGNALFYINGSTMMAVTVELEPTFVAGTQKPLFEGTFDQWYDVSPDGSFVMINAVRAFFGHGP